MTIQPSRAVRTWTLALLVAVLTLSPARAQVATPTAAAPAPEYKVIALTVTPMPTTRPALRHPLVPGALDQEPGNAAPLYMAAAIPVAQTPPDRDMLGSWLEQPVARLPGPEMLSGLGYGGAMNLMEKAARREYVHWDLTLKTEGMRALLPHLSPLRELARMFAARSRMHAAKHDHAAALRDIQTNVALARHLTEESVLVQALVSAAIVSDTAASIEEFVRSPDAPNLYWSFAQLPRPFIDAGRTFQYEKYILQFSYPELRNIEALSPERFQAILADLFAMHGKSREPMTLLMIKAYPQAKRDLVARGRAREEVEAMAVHRVMAHHLVITHAEWCDELGKWYGLPYPQAREGHLSAEWRLRRARERGEDAHEYITSLLPAAHAARIALTTADRRLASLQCVEAIRAHAASNGGVLPASLDQIWETPPPLDPMTGRAFSYRVENGRAVLDCPAPPERRDLGWRYEITIAK